MSKHEEKMKFALLSRLIEEIEEKKRATFYRGQKDCTKDCECHSLSGPRPCGGCLKAYNYNQALTEITKLLEGEM